MSSPIYSIKAAQTVPRSKRLTIAASKIHPGDVLLSRREDFIAKGVTTATGGQFSHAALFVSPVEIFESSLGGVRHATLDCFGPDESPIIAIDTECRSALLLTRSQGLNRDVFLSAYGKTLEEMWGRNYPELRTLAPATKYPILAELVLPLIDEAVLPFILGQSVRSDDCPRRSGLSCAGLIYRFYSNASITLFPNRDICEASVNPGDLKESTLEVVHDALIERDVDESELHKYPGAEAKDTAADLLRLKSRLMGIACSIQEIKVAQEEQPDGNGNRRYENGLDTILTTCRAATRAMFNDVDVEQAERLVEEAEALIGKLTL